MFVQDMYARKSTCMNFCFIFLYLYGVCSTCGTILFFISDRYDQIIGRKKKCRVTNPIRRSILILCFSHFFLPQYLGYEHGIGPITLSNILDSSTIINPKNNWEPITDYFEVRLLY